MAMPGRNFNNDAYRFGMNGQEKDVEIFKGAMSAEFWEYDSRIGRRWNTDPVVKSWESPYLCFGGNPIYYSDVNGDDSEGWEPKKGGGYTYNPDPKKGTETADWTGGDINKVPYEVHGNKDGSMAVSLHEVPVFAEKTREPSDQQKGIYHAMDQFEKGFAIGAVALPAAVVLAPFIAAEASLISGYSGGVSFGIVPTVGSGYLASATARTAIDLAAQTTVYGGDFSQVDVGDAVMTGLLTPFGSAALGGAIDYKPFQDRPLITIFNGKRVEKAVVDASLKFTFGSQGYIGSYTNALGAKFGELGGKNLVPIVNAPFNLGGKLISDKVKTEIFK